MCMFVRLACALVACASLFFQIKDARAETKCPRLVELATLDMVSDTNELVVPVEIVGKPHLMAVGTDVALSFLAKEIVSELKLAKNDSDLYGEVDGGGRITTASVQVSSFKLGQLEAKNVPFLTSQTSREKDDDKTRSVNGQQLAGIIGNNVLTFYDVEFDFAHKKLRLLSPDHCEGSVVYWADGYTDIKFDLLNGVYKIIVSANGTNIEAAISTASEWTYIDTTTARQIGFDVNAPGVEQMSKDLAALDEYPVYKYRIASIQIAGITLQNTEVLVSTLGVSRDSRGETTPRRMLIGLKELRKLRLYFARHEQRLYITPASAGK